MIQAVIFDWAGTTIDYGCFAPIQGFVEGFRAVGRAITVEQARKPMGLLKLDHTRAISAALNPPLTEDEVQKAYAVFQTTLASQLAHHCEPKPGVLEVVSELRRRGLRVGSTTGYTAAMMAEVQPRAALAGYQPDFCVASDEVPGGRPHPYMVWRNLEAFGIDDPRRAVKVGDTEADIAEGRAAGCWTVAVVLGSSELGLSLEEVGQADPAWLAERVAEVRARFYRWGADYIVDDLSSLPEVIDDINRKRALNAPRKLLTPGPLTTRASVKQATLTDHCTWDDEYKDLTRGVIDDLTALVADEHWSTVLLQGSGSYAVEAMVTNFCSPEERLLVLVNGEYGRRIVTIAKKRGLQFEVEEGTETEPMDPKVLATRLERSPWIDVVVIVHCETTTGVLNPLEALVSVAKQAGCRVLVDAMSSFAAYPLSLVDLDIDALASSANKGLEGLPGLAFVVAKRTLLEESAGRSPSHCLDLWDQYLGLSAGGGKFRFTSPTTILLALRQALDDLHLEGGVAARARRYQENHRILVEGLAALGFSSVVAAPHQSYIITTFALGNRDFRDLYHHLKAQGFILYPGKLTQLPTFRIGTIGDVYPEDMVRLVSLLGTWV